MGTVLESERLKLKLLSIDNLSQTYVDWMNDEDIIKYLESGGNYTLKKLKEYLNGITKQNVLSWAIYIKKEGKHIGNVKIHPIDKLKNCGEYGIMIGDKSEWGKGYAMEASKLVINYCFNNLKLSKITLGVVVNHKHAIKLYERLGFIKYKIISNVGLYGGESCDSIRMKIKNVK